MPRVKRGNRFVGPSARSCSAWRRAITPTRASCIAPRRSRSTPALEIRASWAAAARNATSAACGSSASTRPPASTASTYGQFINGLKNAGVTLDRKSLSDLAVVESGSVCSARQAGQGCGQDSGARLIVAGQQQSSVDCRLSCCDWRPMTDVPVNPRRHTHRSLRAEFRAEPRAPATTRHPGRSRPLPRAQERRRSPPGCMTGVAPRAPDVRPASGRIANELKQGDRGSAGRNADAAIDAARPAAGAVDVTLPGREPRARPPPPADDRPRPHGRNLHAHGVRRRRGSGGRRRVALLRRA